jgi:acetyl-CoA carboxylase carboxyltransferase component
MSITSQASQRIAALLDDNSFVEIGAMVTARATDFNLKQTETPSDGCITGYGVIEGNLVYVYSQDASVLGGSIGEMHAKKICNLYDLALKMGAPVIGLIDSAGLRLQEATDALNAFGEIYMKQTQASGVIPQITAVFGTCGGGLALVPALTDFTFMEEKKAKLFVNAPNALLGNEISKCDTSSAAFQAEEAGLVDFVGEEAQILGQIRNLVCMLPSNNEDDNSYVECTDDLNRTDASLANCVGDTSIALSLIADNNAFLEVKAAYAKEMVTGFLKLNGVTVGAVANRSEVYNEEGEKTETFDEALSPAGCEKAADFIQFCDAFNIPVLSLTNVNGYVADKCSEKKIAKAAARLTYAFANATVPKVNVVIGKAYGSAYVAMNSKAIGADMTYCWPDAQIGTMDARLAAKIICDGQGADAVEACAKEYAALQTSATSAARRGYVDAIIEPADTRKYVIGAFEMLFTKREDRPAKKHGTV